MACQLQEQRLDATMSGGSCMLEGKTMAECCMILRHMCSTTVQHLTIRHGWPETPARKDLHLDIGIII